MKGSIKTIMKGAPYVAGFSCLAILLGYVTYLGVTYAPRVMLGIYILSILLVFSYFGGKVVESGQKMDAEHAKWKTDKEKILKPKGRIWDSHE